jgi:hypothetical protein
VESNVNTKLVDIILKNLFKYSPLIVLSVALTFVISLARSYYQDAQTSKSKYEELLGQTQDYVQIKQDLAELQVKYVNDTELRQQEEKEWSKERQYLKGKIVALGNTVFSIPSYSTTQDKPDLATKDFILNELRFGDKTVEGPPFGNIKIGNNGEVTKTVYQAETEMHFVVVRSNDGRYHIYAKPDWVLRDPLSLATTHPELGLEDWMNKPWPMSITGGELVINPVQTGPDNVFLAKRFMFVPHLNLGGYAGLDTAITYGLHGDVSFAGYGYTGNDLDYKLFALGANLAHDHTDVNLIPVKWRIGNVFPLVDDLYIGAGVGVGLEPQPTYFVTLDTTL